MATSKTLKEALDELLEKLEQSDTAIITDLAKQLAENLPLNYKIYLFPGKKLSVSIARQKLSYLYSATYTLVNDEEEQRRKQKKGA